MTQTTKYINDRETSELSVQLPESAHKRWVSHLETLRRMLLRKSS
jgi:hypothetical protein